MKHAILALWLVVGAINAYPLVGVASAERLAALYGIAVADPNLEVLLRHRAVLFGVLGTAIFAAAFRPAWRGAVAPAAFVSMLAFVGVAALVGGYNEAIGRVALADVVASVLLAVALVLERRENRPRVG